jgi:ParB family transcriptional regulator, chromosome partitioning protein
VAEPQRGIGRGLAAILTAAPREAPEELRQVPLELISPNPRQPRRIFDEQGLLALADSIRTRGVLQPLLARPLPSGRYELVAGERRWRAARLAGLDFAPVIVRHHDDAESLELALIENMAREDLSPLEEARACAALTEELGLTREEVGLRVGRSRVAVSNLIRLLALPDEVLELLDGRRLTEGHGRALLLAPENADRRELARRAIAEGWSVRQLEERARTLARGPSVRRITHAPNDADREAAIEQIGDSLGTVLGRDVAVRTARNGYLAELRFDSLQDALDLADRLRDARPPAAPRAPARMTPTAGD